MKKVKPILALLLVAVFFIGMIPMSTVPALAATNLTSSQIKSYVESRVGQSYTKGACLAFVKECFVNLGGPVSTACCAYKYGSSHIVSTSKDNIPIGADVFFGNKNVVCGTCGNYCGHIGIYVGNGEMVHASGGKVLKTSLSYVSNYRGWGYHGGINIVNESATSTPSNVWVSLPFGEESSYKINSSVDISFGADNATQFNLQIYKDQDKYWYGEFYAPSGSTVCPASFDSVGHYSCYVTAVNTSGKTAQSGWIGWDIVDEVPSDLSISLNNRNPFNVYNINDEIIFSLNAKFGYYKHIGIHSSDGTIIKESDVSGCSYSFSTDKTGVYYADFDAMNACGSSRSEKIYFEVVSGVPSKTGIQIIEPTTSDYYIGDTLTFKLIADGANVISWGIHKDNNLVEWNYIECKTLKYTFNTPGEYSISIDAMNEYGTVRSDSYYFTIKDYRNYSVSYNANGGSNAPASQSKTHDVNLTLSSAKPTGKSFTVSYNANGGNVSSSSKIVSQTFTNWNTAANGSGTAYNAGATYSANASVTLYAQYANPSIGSLPTPTRSGYGFDGWYTAANGGTKITDSTKVTASTTLYAHWTKNAETKATVKGVKIEHGVSLNYKSSYTLVPEITADDGAKYTVKYESSNTSVATVGNDGKIYGAKKGNATITCTVTDSYGNVVKDSCNVNVDYSGAQWFIIIVLFGWIWYI